MDVKKLKRRILELSQRGPMHVAPALSCLKIIVDLYESVLRPRDLFVLSKGHGSAALYVVLEELGILPDAGVPGAHPDRWTPGVHACTGSLGHGLGIAVGMALAERIQGKDTQVFCLISDGECQEGSTWEGVGVASNLRLDNLWIVVDNNDWTGLDRISKTHPATYPIEAKFHAFGWAHYLIQRTIKGDGISYMIDAPIWHYRSPNPAEYQQALREIECATPSPQHSTS